MQSLVGIMKLKLAILALNSLYKSKNSKIDTIYEVQTQS